MFGSDPRRFLPKAALLCGLLLGTPLWAQEPQPAPPPLPPPAAQTEMTVPSDGAGLMTLHVYSNLIQMPVLVLSPGMLPVTPIKPERFALRLDYGPWYRPTHVRPEGNDPLSLTILLDFAGGAADLMPKIAETIDKLAPEGLTPHDHVSIFAMQCGLFDMLRDVPAGPGVLQPKMAEALARWAERNRTKHPPPCDETLHLWDALGIATLRLAQLPGRRVIIAVTDGVDRGSKNSADVLAVAMQVRAITAFAVRPELPPAPRLPTFGGVQKVTLAFQSGISTVTTDEPLAKLTEMSGGMTIEATRWNAGKQFARIPQLLRGRYILEFPRPMNSTGGNHQIDVQVSNSADFVRVSGTSIPLPDPKIAADPTTLPNDPSLTPQMGKSPIKPKPPPPESF